MAKFFRDWKSLLPYEEQVVNPDGRKMKVLCPDFGTLKCKPDPLGHGRWHTLNNLFRPDGSKVLPRGVRKIDYIPGEGYILSDNNEDELINRGDVRGGFRISDYVERWNFVNEKGELLSEEWFDKVSESTSGFMKVLRNGKENLLSVWGGLILEDWADYISASDGNQAVAIMDGTMFSCSSDGTHTKLKRLEGFPVEGKYRVGRFDVKDGVAQDIGEPFPIFSTDIKPVFPALQTIIRYSDKRLNIVDRSGWLVLGKWYENLEFSGIDGYVFVREKGDSLWTLIRIDGKEISKIPIVSFSRFKKGECVVYDGRYYSMMDINGEKLVDNGYTSFLGAPGGPIWEMELMNSGMTRHFLMGQFKDEAVYAAHELIAHGGLYGFFERNGIWYYPDRERKMIPLFEIKPEKL